MGFFSDLFDLSFTRFVTTKIIKVLYVLAMVLIGLFALVWVVAAFRDSVALGVLSLFVLVPLVSLLYLIYTRVLLEFVIQVFRITELLRDQNELQRAAFSNAGWLAGQAQPYQRPLEPYQQPLTAQTAPLTPAQCPKCGTEPTPVAAFCRKCGTPLH